MFRSCLGLLYYLAILVRVLLALVCKLCAARPHNYSYLFCDVSLTVVIGIDSLTIFLIPSRVWVCPCPCLKFFLIFFFSRRLVVFKYFVVHFVCLVTLFGLAFSKYVYSSEVSCTLSPNMPTERSLRAELERQRQRQRLKE